MAAEGALAEAQASVAALESSLQAAEEARDAEQRATTEAAAVHASEVAKLQAAPSELASAQQVRPHPVQTQTRVQVPLSVLSCTGRAAWWFPLARGTAVRG